MATSFLSRDLLLQVNKPAQYLGGEIHSVVKPWENQQVKIALAFPDLYEIGMSHLGLKILYHILNKLPGVAAERAYAPAKDMEALLREHALPLFSLENKKSLREFDLVGFSLQYELSYTNVLNMLELAGIPVSKENRRNGEAGKRRRDLAAITHEAGSNESSSSRPPSLSPAPPLSGSSFPLVFAGGPNAFNPEPMADFIDFFVIGDGEEVMVRIANKFKEFKTDGVVSREEQLKKLATLDGVYVPEFYDVGYYSTGEIKAWKPLVPEAPAKVKKAVLPTLEGVDYPTELILPNIGIVHDRVPVEVRRGCSCGCRFCQAGYIYRPVRERSAQEVIALCHQALQKTGYEEFSLLSLSTADYTPLAEVVPHLTKAYAREGVSLSLPSLRLNKFNLELAQGVQEVRKSTLTFAPEAGTQRLRDVINKGVTDQDLFSTVETVFRAGWKRLKLYFMIGLPTETDDDVKGIAHLANQVYELGRRARGRTDHEVSITISTFVPKGVTPFQWAGQVGPEEIRRRQQLVRANVKYRNIGLKFNPVHSSVVEGALSRGDRRLGPVIYDAWRSGCTFDGWDESFDYAKWQKAFEKNNLDLNTSLRERGVEEVMPWDIVEAGISKEFLREEWERAQKTEPVEDCALQCYNCGISTTFKIDNLFANVESTSPLSPPSQGEEACPEHSQREAVPHSELRTLNSQSVQRLRIRYAKTGPMAYTAHLDLLKIFERTFRRLQLPVAFSSGFNPHPRISFAAPLGMGMESVSEYCDLELYQKVEPGIIFNSLKAEFPVGISLLELKEVDLKEDSLMARVAYAAYRYTVSGIPQKEFDSVMGRFLGLSEYMMTRHHPKKGDKVINILPLIDSLASETDEGALVLQGVLRTGSEGGLRPEELLSALSQFSGYSLKALHISRTALLDKNRKEFL